MFTKKELQMILRYYQQYNEQYCNQIILAC